MKKDELATLIDFRGLRIKLASPEEIKNWSYGEVTKPETINYRTWRPEKDGLFCERIFGPTKDFECYCGKYRKSRYRGVICDKCGVEVTHSRVRRERMGHISLAAPVVHLWFLRNPPFPLSLLLGIPQKELEAVVYFAKWLVVDIENKKRAKALAKLKAGVRQEIRRVKREGRERVKQLQLEAKEEKKRLSEKIRYRDQAMVARQELEVRYKQKIRQVEHQTQSEVERLRTLGQALADLVRRLQVKSTLSEEELMQLQRFGAASFFKVAGGAEAILPLLEAINLAKEAKKLRRELKTTTSNQKRKKIRRQLRLINGMLKVGIHPSWMVLRVLPVIPPALRPIVQLAGGRFATSDLNDLYRRVINRNNRLKRLLQLGAPEIILRNEKRMLQEAVDILIDATKATRRRTLRKRPPRSLSDLLRGKKGRFRRNLLGKRVDYSGRSVIVVGPELKLNQCGLPKQIALEMFRPFVLRELMVRGLAPNIRSAKNLIDREAPEVYEILEDVVANKLVLLNRAPTLHKLSIQAFYPVLVDGLAIRIHPCICAGYNADFDGDQMGVHLPLSAKAQQEAREAMIASRNLLKPADGSPIVTPSKEMVVGCYYLTSIRQEDLGKLKTDGWHELFLFASPEEALIAYQLGQIELRQLIGVKIGDKLYKTTVGRIIFNQNLPEGIGFINEAMTNNRLKQLFSLVYQTKGEEAAAELVDTLKEVGFWGATVSGVSLSIFDCGGVPQKKRLIKKAEAKVAQLEQNLQEGLITPAEKQQLVQNTWIETTEKIAALTWQQLPADSPIKIISKAGIKRVSPDQIKQISGMRGLVVDPLGRIVPLPTKSNFREGLSVFEYITGARGSRKGLTDTALKTADAGYLTRRLVDVAHACLIREEDCRTHQGLIIRADELGREQSFPKRIVGRFLAQKVVDPKTGKLLLKKGELLTEEKVDLLVKAGVKEVVVRSPLFCRTKYGVCVRCYGWDLSNKRIVEIGTPVGVIAAQSIGEPGTQLTLRTKHFGGVIGLDVTQGLPRVQELFEVRTPKNLAPMAEIDGQVKIKETSEGFLVRVRGRQGKQKVEKTYLVPLTAQLLVKDGQKIKKGTQLSSGALDVKEVMVTRGLEAAQEYLLNEIQKVYESQGISIHDKHFEVIIREMSSKVRIDSPGDTDFLIGEYVEQPIFQEVNQRVRKEGGRPAKGKRVLLGITQAALHTHSWLSAASFQETTNVLTEAAILGKLDNLIGLKENVIIGRLIPTDPERVKVVFEE